MCFNCPDKRKSANLVDEPGAEPAPVKFVCLLERARCAPVRSEPVKLVNKFAALEVADEEDPPERFRSSRGNLLQLALSRWSVPIRGCDETDESGDCGVTLGQEQTAGRSDLRGGPPGALMATGSTRLVPADYVCRGSGQPCETELPGPLLMMPGYVPLRTPLGSQSLNVLELATPRGLNLIEEPEFTDINIVLDSGAADHVADNVEAPGYDVKESPGSKRGDGWIAANGELIPNKGEMVLDLTSGNSNICSKFQVAKTSRPLWSVGRPCDAGYRVVFDKEKAVVTHKASGKEVTTFPRKNAVYVCDMKLRNPKATQAKPERGFQRQER